MRDLPIPCPDNGPFPQRSGNHVIPLIDGVPAFARMAEAVDQALHSVLLTVAFFASDFRFKDGRDLLDLLNAAAERGLDVRVIFWRPTATSSGYGRTFEGSVADRALLERRHVRFRIRWDGLPGVHVHHQKSWMIDAGHETETAFVGGMNLTELANGSPGHGRPNERHDIYAELTGPCATDVHHNFVQRWNSATGQAAPNGVWGHNGDDGLNPPKKVSPERGNMLAQIQRMIPKSHYAQVAADNGNGGDLRDGETTILEQYQLAIDAAQRTIYIENQAIPIAAVASHLHAVLERGVTVVLVVPAKPKGHVREARNDPMQQDLFEALKALDRFDNFTLAGLAGLGEDGTRQPVYVHAKAMLVDDSWATVGSCNLHAYSLGGHTEMNISVWDSGFTKDLRCRLLDEHLRHNTRNLDDIGALTLFRKIATTNRTRRSAGNHAWDGIVFSLSAKSYGA